MQVLRASQEESSMSLLLAVDDNNTSDHNTSPTRLSPRDTEKAKKIERKRGKNHNLKNSESQRRRSEAGEQGPCAGVEAAIVAKQQHSERGFAKASAQVFVRWALSLSLSLSLVPAPTRATQSRVGRKRAGREPASAGFGRPATTRRQRARAKSRSLYRPRGYQLRRVTCHSPPVTPRLSNFCAIQNPERRFARATLPGSNEPPFSVEVRKTQSPKREDQIEYVNFHWLYGSVRKINWNSIGWIVWSTCQ